MNLVQNLMMISKRVLDALISHPGSRWKVRAKAFVPAYLAVVPASLSNLRKLP